MPRKPLFFMRMPFTLAANSVVMHVDTGNGQNHQEIQVNGNNAPSTQVDSAD